VANTVEILVKGKTDTDAMFKAITKGFEQVTKEAVKTNDILGKLSSDLKGKLGSAAEGAAGNLGGLGSALTSMGPAGLAAAAGIGAVMTAVGAVVKVSMDAALAAAAYGDKIVDLAGKTDMSTKSLQAFDVMARTGNTTIEAISGAVLKMGRGIVAGSDAFRRLGLDVEKLAKMSPEEQFKTVAIAIEGLGTNAERSAARVAIFGKAGDELTTVLHEAATGATELGGALSEDALQASADLQDQVDLLHTAWERVILQFGAAIAQSPEVQKGLEAITEALVFMAEKIGEWAPTIARLFQEINHQIQLTLIGIRSATKAATGDMLGAWKDFKNGVEQLHLDEMFSDVKGGSSNNVKPRSFGPSSADVKKAADAYKKMVEERRKAVEEENKLHQKAALQWDAFFKTIMKEESDLTDWVRKEAQARQDARVKGILAEHEAGKEAREKQKEDEKKALEDARKLWEQNTAAIFEAADAAGQFGDAIGGALGDALKAVGALINGFGGVRAGLDQIKNAGSGLGGILSKAIGGLGIASSIFSAGKGVFDAIFGGAKKAREEMEKLRSEFVKSAGGMQALKAQAAAAGVSLDGMFRQKSADALAKQIDAIKGKLKDWDDAQRILREGQEKWNIAVGDMGPKFASLELDKRAQEMVLFFNAAGGVGANMNAVTEGMKADVMSLVAQYKAAGLAIPEAMKPMLQKMLENGDLIDENGKAYESFEEAGITFAKSMEGVLANIGDQIQKLMEVLARGFKIPIDFEVSGQPSAPGGGGGHPPKHDVPEFAEGGHTGYGSGAFPAMLHPRETVVPDDKMASFLASAMRLAGPMNGGGMVIHNTVNMGTRTVWKEASQATRRRQMQVQPNSLRRF
jgi:hypothetical protein